MPAIKEIIKQRVALMHLPGENPRKILLTFDDGPHPEVTARILDLLDLHNARAIFFVVGKRIPRAPYMLREILDRGHLLGNHSFAHEHDLKLAAYRDDLKKTQDSILAETGRAPYFFRPPQGSLTPASVLAPRLLGLSTMLWSVDSCDWRLRSPDEVAPSAEQLLNVFRRRAPERDILLFHDDNPRTPEVLAQVLPGLAALGVEFADSEEAIFRERAGARS